MPPSVTGMQQAWVWGGPPGGRLRLTSPSHLMAQSLRAQGVAGGVAVASPCPAGLRPPLILTCSSNSVSMHVDALGNWWEADVGSRYMQ